MKAKNCRMFFLLFFLLVTVLEAEKVRDYLLTGPWYPGSESELKELLKPFFAQAQKLDIPGNVVGIISPHAGFVYSGLCAARAYKQLEGNSTISRVIILGSSHHAGFYGACLSDFTHESTPLGKLEVDRKVVEDLAQQKHFQVNNRVMLAEHSIENQLPFLQMVFPEENLKIVSILFGQLDQKDFPKMAKAIKNHVDSKTLVVASTDLNHYGSNFGYTPFTENIQKNLTRLDLGMVKTILDRDCAAYFAYKQKTKITMCGFIPVGILLNLFPASSHGAILADYYKSGDRNQDYSQSVSYASMVLWEKNPGKGESGSIPKNSVPGPVLTDEEQKILLVIARDTLKYFYSDKDYVDSIEKKYPIPENVKKVSGVFVTLKKNQDLRGCIGSLIGHKPLYLEVMDQAINAAVRDPRFNPVRKAELAGLRIEISVMTPLQKISDYRTIRLGIDGVIIKKGYFQAVYLPQVATETGWNLDEFLGNLCRKAGLDSDAYQSPDTEFFVFQAQVFGED